jgi:predicted permease
MLQDYKLGVRMLLKYPGLTIAGGLALAVAIGAGAGWYDLAGKLLSPTIPLPGGDRLVSIETQNVRTNELEPRVARDLLEWRRDLRSIEDLGAYRTERRNLIVDNASPVLVQTAELTAAAFRAARRSPLLGRGLLESDERPGAPGVLVIGYDLWQRSFGARDDVVGSAVRMGNTLATVIGVMPEGFGYPVNHGAWMPLPLRTSYGVLEGPAISVIGRLVPGMTLEQANAELGVLTERAAAALPASHQFLRPRVTSLAGKELPNLAELAVTYLPTLLVLLLACTTVGTLIYARTAIREGEIALRSALGASRTRIIGQLFVEALVLAAVAAPIGLIAADRTLRWGIAGAFGREGGPPFWMTPGLALTTTLYAGALAVASAIMLSILPALRATRARVQPYLANLGTGGATLRFGRVWTTLMLAQVALTAMAIPIAIEGSTQAIRNMIIRARFPSGEYVSARVDFDQRGDGESVSAFEERRARMYAELERRVALEPGVIAIAFADGAPGTLRAGNRRAAIEVSPGAGRTFDFGFNTWRIGPEFFTVFDREIVAGRAFHGGDFNPGARTVIVNEAFVRGFLQRGGIGSPVGVRLRHSDRSAFPAAAAEYEIVGVVRDLGLDPDDEGREQSFVFYPASAAALPSLVMSVRLGGNPAALAGRLPAIAAAVDGGLSVQDARPLRESIRSRDLDVMAPITAGAAVTSLVLLLSAIGIFSLMSVSVSRRTREIGLRAALGASPRRVLTGVLAHAILLIGSGITAGGGLLLLFVALGAGPTGRPRDDVMTFAIWIGITAAIMLAACLIACVEPARRALRISPIDALREA